MGGAPTAEYQQTATKTMLDPKIAEALLGQIADIRRLQPGFETAAQNIAGQFQTQFNPQAAQGPDAVTRAQIALGEQNLLNQAAGVRAGIARNLVGQPGASQALQRIATTQARIQQNPLMFTALQQQAERENMANQMRLQGMQAGNAALLQQLAAYQAPIQSAVQATSPILAGGQLTGTQQQFAMKGERSVGGVNQMYGNFLNPQAQTKA
jgi:hypothetical protein